MDCLGKKTTKRAMGVTVALVGVCAAAFFGWNTVEDRRAASCMVARANADLAWDNYLTQLDGLARALRAGQRGDEAAAIEDVTVRLRNMAADVAYLEKTIADLPAEAGRLSPPLDEKRLAAESCRGADEYRVTHAYLAALCARPATSLSPAQVARCGEL